MIHGLKFFFQFCVLLLEFCCEQIRRIENEEEKTSDAIG